MKLNIRKNEVNEIQNIRSVNKTSNITVENAEGFYATDYYYTDIYDEKRMKSFIKCCEKQVRTSQEYHNYIGFLKGEVGLDKCAILGNVQSEDDGIVTIEEHHYPFTLYDIVQLEVMRRLLNHEKVNSFLVSQEVMKLHYKNMIGLVPVCRTVHKLAHKGEIFINLKSVYGDLPAFIERYKDTMNDDQIENYNKLVEMSNNNVAYSEHDILRVKEKNLKTEDLS